MTTAVKTTRTHAETRWAIHRTLPAAIADEWLTAQQVADLLDIGYSTVTEHLRSLAKDGLAESTRRDRCTVWRRRAGRPNPENADIVGPVVSQDAEPVGSDPEAPAAGDEVLTATDVAQPKPKAVWQRGALQDAILDYLREFDHPQGFTPWQVAVALNSHVGAVAYGLSRLTVKGSALLACPKPLRYRAA